MAPSSGERRRNKRQPAVTNGGNSASARSRLRKCFFVLMKAKEDAWVSVVADGKSVMQRVLTLTRQKMIKAGKQIILRTGNAGGIDVSFNGRSLGAIGNENEPRTLTFNCHRLSTISLLERESGSGR